MKKTITYCNRCGKEFDETDMMCDFHVRRRIGYGSVHDGELFVLDLCCDCLDNLIDSCKIKPILDRDFLTEEDIKAFSKPVTVLYPADGNTDPYQIPMEV